MQILIKIALLLALATMRAMAGTSPNVIPLLMERQNGGDDWCDYCQWCGDGDLGADPDCGVNYTSTDGQYYQADAGDYFTCCGIGWDDDSVYAYSWDSTATSNQCTLFQSTDYQTSQDSSIQSGYFVDSC